MANKKPKKTSSQDQRSAYSALMEVAFTVNFGGKPRKMNAKEALELKTFEEGLNGNPAAVRKVLKWIEEREASRKAQQRKPFHISFEFEYDPVSIDEALLLLDIAIENEQKSEPGERHLLLKPWAVQEGIQRLRKTLSKNEIKDIYNFIDGPEQVCWPEGSPND